MFQALTRTCFPPDNHFTENYLIAYEGSNSLSEDNPGTIQPQLKYTSAAIQEKNNPCRITPRLASTFAHLRVPSSSTARVGRE